MYGASIPNLNGVSRRRGEAANLGCGILLKLMWGREDWILNVNGTTRKSENFQVPLESKKIKFRSHQP